MNLFLTIVIGGILGGAIDAGYDGRLSQYITGPDSYAIHLFSPEKVALGKGGWQGEHAGKWMYTAARAYERTADPVLGRRLESVADYLASLQEENGYLGCYREDKRYYHRPAPDAMTVDWDTWIMAYLIKGFTRASIALDKPGYADTAVRIVEFLHWTVFEQGIKIVHTGQHSGMAGCGILDPLCDLYAIRPEKKVKEMIDVCIAELDDTPCLQLISLAGKGYDVSLIGNGKIYEMNRCLTGMAKAYRLFGDKRLLAACLNAWTCIHSHHLTTLGGPWGGINVCTEIFNRPAEWAPYECTETCSVMEWMHFTWEMLQITGDGKYAGELEKTAYNALMAARAEDGLRWEYYVRTNGELTPRGDWACCWSSGMNALEDIPVYMYENRKDGIYVNIISESEYAGAGVRIVQSADYARTGKARFSVAGSGRFTLAVHRPAWAREVSVKANGKDAKYSEKDGYIRLKRSWKDGDTIDIEFPLEVRYTEKTWEYRNAGGKEYNFSNWYNGFSRKYVTFSAGPLVYATNHADSFDNPNPIEISRKDIENARLEGSLLVAGDIRLRPVALMPPFDDGPQYRTIWFQVRQ